MEEDNTNLALKLKRYAQVSGAVGGLLAKLAGDKYLGISIDQEEHSQDLKESLGNLKGPLMKIAQMLATIPDMLPRAYSEALQELQSNAPPMGPLFVKRRMKTELGSDWESRFKEFDKKAIAAASLGQVHKAISLDGKNLAVKLQYPDMKSAVDSDLSQFRLVLKMYEKTGGALETDDMFLEIRDRLYEELDYNLEARHIKMFTHMLSSLPEVHVPEVVSELSTKRLLTMEWLEGRPIKNALSLSLDERNQLATSIFKAWYTPFYHFGIIHGDPHLGNYTFRSDLHINLFDFGCIRVFDPKFVMGVLSLYDALKRGNQDDMVAAYESWGFKALTKAHIEILNLWAQYLYEPILDDRVRSIDPDHSGKPGKEIAGRILSELRKVGAVSPPREFVFMDRAAVGMGSVFMRLKAELNWHQLFEELIKDCDYDYVTGNQSKTLRL